MSVLSSIKTYIQTYAGLVTNAPVWVNHLGDSPTEYAVVPLGGGRIVATYLDQSSEREFPFALQSAESTLDEINRLASIGFFEAFSDWLESQTLADVLPTMEANQTAKKIEALGWGFLVQQGDSGTGIYQVQCKLTYGQSAPGA